MTSPDEVSFLTLLKNRNFRRLFFAQTVSSLGDWIGVIAIAVLANKTGGETAVGAVMTARVLPGFVAGPIAGVMADRWDRRKMMVTADLCRAAIIFSLPFFQSLVYLLLASVFLESLTLMWGPAKDASLPHVVPAEQITHANSLNLIAVYGPWPLASLVFASMSTLGGFLGHTVPVLEGLTDSPEAMALWVDSLTFCFSAAMIYGLVLPSSRHRGEPFDLRAIKRDLVEGVRFVAADRKVRPWLLGIAFTFTAAGGVFSLGVAFVDKTLGGGSRGFAFLIGILGTGMIVGLLAIGQISKRIQKDVLFSSSILLLGVGLIALASMSSLNSAIPIAAALGFFGGAAYSTAYSLMHENTSDELRGRTFSAAYTVIRIGTLVGLGLFPLLSGVIGDNVLNLFGESVDIPGTRATLWVAGLVAVGGAGLSMRAIGSGRDEQAALRHGFFVVFEGGEGAGKSTQMAALAEWLKARGVPVVTTREPGGTQIGSRIRALLLDPEAGEMDPHTEALLYASDRSQHAHEVIRPALRAGKVVISDRYLDSSLAYQGIARGLGLEEIYRISEWATGGLLPDIVFLLRIEPEAGLRRIDGDPDRMEGEDPGFHDRVGEAYLELAQKFPKRFVVLDATRPKANVHAEVVSAYQERAAHVPVAIGAPHDLAAPGPPVPR